MMKISYIWHDCFVLEAEKFNLVFDYWLDEDGSDRQHPYFLDKLNPELPLYVFVTHFHKDHYNPEIFSWAGEFKKVRYIVSSDVWKRMRHIVSSTSVYKGPKVKPEIVTILRPGQSFEDVLLKVSAFPSTDIGNSYLVEFNGRTVFHAGDLNCWAWREESTSEEVHRAEAEFEKCLLKIEEYLQQRDLDYCFFPVDSRIGLGYAYGASMFVGRFRVMHFFPMHFALGNSEERRRRTFDAMQFHMYANPERGEYIPLGIPGTSYYNFV